MDQGNRGKVGTNVAELYYLRHIRSGAAEARSNKSDSSCSKMGAMDDTSFFQDRGPNEEPLRSPVGGNQDTGIQEEEQFFGPGQPNNAVREQVSPEMPINEETERDFDNNNNLGTEASGDPADVPIPQTSYHRRRREKI